MHLFMIILSGLLSGLLLCIYIYLTPQHHKPVARKHLNYAGTTVTIEKDAKQVEFRILK